MKHKSLLAIARYFAFSECIECKLSLLTGKKELEDFYEKVFPFVLSTLNNKSDSDECIQQEREMWLHAAGQQVEYVKALCKKHFKFQDKLKYKEFLLLVDTVLNERKPFEDGEGIIALYDVIEGLDKIPCDYAKRMHDIPPENTFKVFAAPSEDEEQLNTLLTHIVESINLYHDVVVCIQEKVKAPKIPNPFPLSIVASLAVFTSHFGRALCLYYSSPSDLESENDTPEEAIKKSLEHLRRCLMDTCKLVIDCLNSYPELFGQQYAVPEEFWKIALEARKMEHDRAPIKSRMEQYEKTYPFIRDFLRACL